ncbi:unnamed protein product, partial [Adineta steineri]
GKGANLINPYKKRDRDQARSMMDLTPTTTKTSDHHSTCSSSSSKFLIEFFLIVDVDDIDEHVE